jgi:hypothetical protein
MLKITPKSSSFKPASNLQFKDLSVVCITLFFFSFSNGEKCFAGNILDYKTKCEQKYNVIKLVTANVETHALEYQKFQIPSTCVCTYTKMFDD